MYRHSANDIRESKTRVFCTLEEKQKWNESSDVNNEELNNMKEKLEGVEEGANKYIHPNDVNTRHVSDTQISKWNAKADGDHKHDGMGDITNEELDSMKEKLEGIEPGANKYIHPNDTNTRHVTDSQVSKWDNGIITEDERSSWNDAANNIPNGGCTSEGICTITKPTDLSTVSDNLSDSGTVIVIEGTPSQVGHYKIKDLRLGKYVFTMRVKTCHHHDNVDEILGVHIYKKDDIGTPIASASYTTNDIDCDDYSIIHFAVEYKGPKAKDNELLLELHTLDGNSLIRVDYIMCNNMIPSVFF